MRKAGSGGALLYGGGNGARSLAAMPPAAPLLLLCAVSALCVQPPLLPPSAVNELLSPRLPRDASHQAWLRLVEDYARSKLQERRRDDPTPFRLDLDVSSPSGRRETLPVLVLPVPVASESCRSDNDHRDKVRDFDDDYDRYYERRRERERQREREQDRDREQDRYRPRAPYPARDDYPSRKEYPSRNEYPLRDEYPSRDAYSSRNEYQSQDRNPYRGEPYSERERPPSRRPLPQRDDSPVEIDVRKRVEPPLMPKPVSSEQLVALFRAQTPTAPELPPALLPTSPVAGPAIPLPALQLGAGPTPPRPVWAGSLRLRAELHVPRADYTEPYEMTWSANGGGATVVMHGGTAKTLMQQMPDGAYQRIEIREDNSDGTRVVRCGVAPPQPASAADLAPPALPDTDLFEFHGYRGDTEEWRRVEQATGARSEALTVHHALVVRRDAGGRALPLSYSVDVDSSVLGPRCDSYAHTYLEAEYREPPPVQHQPRQCDQQEPLDPREPEHVARLQPMKEFTLPTPDPRYDVLIDRFKKEFERNYTDDKEEAVRKNLFIQSTRFVTSGNRQGSTFEVAVNFLGDRLTAELDELLGVELGEEYRAAERFPHSAAEADRLAGDLPDAFDWRDEGGVTHVRYQGSCSSCWAMAVTGAVEGALFRRTQRLQALAEQCLVDCAHPFGGNGCKGTWPSHAYDYIEERGLPALADYGAHRERVEQCRDRSVQPVTRISAHVNVTQNSVPALKVAIREHAPTVVIIDAKAKSFIFYKKGILYDDRCGKAKPKLNHAVLAVAWGQGGEYFTVKNSWSAAWGEQGYARLQAPANTCGVLALPSYPRLEREDVLKG